MKHGAGGAARVAGASTGGEGPGRAGQGRGRQGGGGRAGEGRAGGDLHLIKQKYNFLKKFFSL